MTDLTLYVDENWASPYAFSNFVALKEKGLSFEVADVALSKKETFHGDYKVRSLTGRVPMLRHGDYFLTESTAITAEGQGYADVPGLYGTEQLDGWKAVTRAVHERQGRMVGFSGQKNLAASLSRQQHVPGTGIYVSIQGNILAGDEVVTAAVASTKMSGEKNQPTTANER